MKKICYSVLSAIAIMIANLNVFADNNPNEGLTFGRMEIIGKVIWFGIAIFTVGMVCILLSIFKGRKADKYDDEYYEEYDEYDEYDEYEDYDEYEESYEEAVDTEPIEAEESAVEEAPAYSEEHANEEEIEPEPEPEPIVEEVPENDKMRITLTGMNNADVKVMEFSGKITMGRKEENDIVVNDAAISGKHCELSCENGLLYVTDLESTNGTFVNDEAVVRAEIKSGDVLIVGKCKYRVTIA